MHFGSQEGFDDDIWDLKLQEEGQDTTTAVSWATIHKSASTSEQCLTYPE